MIRRIFYTTLLFTLLHLPQDPLAAGFTPSDLTISYSIGISSAKGGDMGIGETYNGGVETLFAGARQMRLRLVSLMRIQSIFMSTEKDMSRKYTIVKESGKNKYVTSLSEEEWGRYNKKYDGAVCKLTGDTTQLLNYTCKKAIITLKDGRTITAWYTTGIQAPAFSRLEPAFSGIPGLVLKYEYTHRRKTISYTATSITHHPISPEVFTVPRAH
jgi:hypothetical protein